jgi:nitric oxide reductase activation protein
VYQHRRKTATDVSVLVLLDCSGSEAESSGGERIWDRQRRAAGAILESLEQVGARSAAYGFNSHGRQVRMLRVKDFTEPLGPRAKQRLMSLEPAGFTRMGGALRHATALLVRGAGTPRKLLLVISDGLPYDDEYEDLYAQGDTRKALEEATTAGIGCACFAIGTTTSPESLERVWGSATYTRLPDGRQWARPIGPAIETALWSATGVQRTTPRLERATA